jgi:8-oxo-dGTP diphosphatase
MDCYINLLNGSGAFLRNGSKYLLMKRSSDREIAPNVWSCIGGKSEKEEINDPLKTCFREIEEETGIKKENIFNLKLRYIIIRRKISTIRQSYLYFGETDILNISGTEEGSLH